MSGTTSPGRLAPLRHELEHRFGVTFVNPGLLRQALVHASYINENPDDVTESNQRLEFLGDAMIGLAVASDLFERYPGSPEGELTPLRAALVKGSTLARVARSLDLGNLLLLGRGEAESGGHARESNLADAFEAVVGAVFEDRGYGMAERFVLDAMADEFESSVSPDFQSNPKSILQELVQCRDGSLPVYRVTAVTGAEHARVFAIEVLVSGELAGRGIGRRKTEAEQAAARDALKTLSD